MRVRPPPAAQMNKPKVLVIVGPTASGKTSLAITLAQKFDGEVISADSRQVYKRLDIGTAKATVEEMAGVSHHLIDVVDIDTPYSVTEFKSDANVAITRILNRDKLPIIAGGTFFYVDALLGKSPISEIPPNPELRSELEAKNKEDLFAALEKLDPRRAAEIDPNNKRRLVRALEIIAAIGAVPKKEQTTSPYRVLTIGVKTDKEELRERFKSRAEDWLKNGFKEEVEKLLADDVSRERIQEIGFEYTLMQEFIDGQIDRDDFTQKFIEKNWQYAKRQLMWLKRDSSIMWFDRTDSDAIFEKVQLFLAD